MLQPRFYRNNMGTDRFKSFSVQYKDSDLWIGVDPASFTESMPQFALQKLIQLRNNLEAYIKTDTAFSSSFSPTQAKSKAPKLAVEMCKAAAIANTGPMAAVAGIFSEYLGKAIASEFNTEEMAIENGGDIYLELKENLVLSVYAGDSSLSGKVGVEIPKQLTPLGICTSAGTVGPSTSLGKADAVVVVHPNTAIADALATSIGNKVKTANDIQAALMLFEHVPNLLSVLIICEGQIGIKGELEMRIMK